jgi:hypothetical protein
VQRGNLPVLPQFDFIQILKRPPKASSSARFFRLDFSVYQGNAATFEKFKCLSAVQVAAVTAKAIDSRRKSPSQEFGD